MAEFIDALRDKQFRRDFVSGMKDAANRGAAAFFGGPVDLAAMVMRPFGYSTPDSEVIGGSEWLGKQMEKRGMVSGARNPVAEFLAAVALPAGMTKAAPGIFKAEQKAIQNAMAPRTLDPQTGAIVWHGTPHKFDKFDSSKIGTGEGAQVYGHGLYLAESKDVANEYAGKLSKKFVAMDNFTPDPVQQRIFDRMSIGANTTQYGQYRPYDVLLNIIRHGTDEEKLAAKAIESKAGFLGRNLHIVDEGSLYKVDLPDEQIAKMLDWDKPLSQQAPEVYSKAKKAFDSKYGAGFFDNYAKSGADLKELIQNFDDLGRGGAEHLMRQQGIPGIRYLDGGSRGTGQGTSNFVVFPGGEEYLQILERNGKPLIR